MRGILLRYIIFQNTKFCGIINALYTNIFAIIDFSQTTFEMTALCHSEVPAEESVLLKDILYRALKTDI